MKLPLLLSLLLTVSSAPHLHARPILADDGPTSHLRRSGDLVSRKLGGSKHGGVATEAAPCSEIGVDILKKGGNAADAIIAAGLCVGTIAAYHSGFGGGGFMLVRYKDPSGKFAYENIDFRETMPAGGNETMYAADATQNKTLSTIGGLAVGVPGELRGWEMLHKRHGHLPWKELFKPAIKLARHGFKVNIDLADAIQEGKSFILNDTRWAEVYAPKGTLLVEGDTVYRKTYANTLEQVARHGAHRFYHGKIAKRTVQTIRDTGGIMTMHDMSKYKAIIRTPVSITYRGARIFSTVAPSSGAVVLSALKILEGYQANYNDSQSEINVTTHRLLEATQFAYGQRTQYGDPAFVPNVTYLENYYLREDVVKGIRSKINDTKTFGVGYYDPSKYTATAESGTSHLAVIDGSGMSVSLTTTINTYWGSRVMTPDGIICNNEMDDFSSPGQTNAFGFASSPINYIRPGKRPQSSIASSIAEDLHTGEILIATGSAGGSRIITATLQHLYHHLDQQLNAYEAVAHPRWHDQLSGQTFFEWKELDKGIVGYNNDTVGYLAALGHNVTWTGVTGSTAHVVLRTQNGTIEAASDPRKAAGAGVAF
ncbi:gamma-glutamyltransferase [Microbotryum lychnidis-dioicae p1A1 Lamole]|uniref:Glutathione hydrolase n=2 Tax=Microbotryum lychnidis-dioicae (strain p1A1 Lamole / MvSl-1064) TaxID=683840 RepID=U5H3Z0_USTV1|nr:gamma-glutamyltransferase [Microbotryum lychnidis-dioicae p1A1 Lamole]|eukprot:KDE07773.1 gamma-glutamyltransferase [Microbotryum lychnidis-dioicae p1A1 Lamole]